MSELACLPGIAANVFLQKLTHNTHMEEFAISNLVKISHITHFTISKNTN